MLVTSRRSGLARFALAVAVIVNACQAVAENAPRSGAVPSSFSPFDPRSLLESPATDRVVSSEPFGLDAPKSEGGVFEKWRGVERDIAKDEIVLAQCRNRLETCESPAARQFLAMVDRAKLRGGRARIGEINRAINLAIRPMSDMAQHGQPDVWSAPLATLSSGRGDCEDYAIAKFVALRALGFSDADLRLMVVHDATTHEDHAVVTVRFEERWLILDNRRLTLADAAYSPYKPLFALRHEDANDHPQPEPAMASGAHTLPIFI